MLEHCIATDPTTQPLFISTKHSCYDGDKVIYKFDLTQEDALAYNLNSLDSSELDIMEDVQAQMMDRPEEFIENPCHYFVDFKKGKFNLVCKQSL